MKRFGEIVKEARIGRGWSLKQAAGQLGTFKGYICGIEGGKINPPSPKMVRKMAKVYGLHVQELLARSVIEKLPKGLEKASLYTLLGDAIANRA